MRIVQLTRDFPPATSGIGDHVARTSAVMAAAGDEVAVVCSAGADPLPGLDVRPVIERWDAGGVAAIAAAVRDARPDAIVWHYNPFQIGRRGIPAPAPRLARALAAIAPLTVVAHELWYPWGRSGFRGLMWAITQRRGFRGVAAAARSIVVTTDARRAQVSKRYPDTPVTAIPAGATVDAHPDAPGRAAIRASLGIPASAFVAVHLGAIGEGRDLRPVLEAVRALRAEGADVRLILAGRTGVAPPSGEGIHATGPRNHAQLSGILAAADCYLFAEPTGPVQRKTSLLSALAHALPVIAYAGRDADTFFRDERNVLLVEPSAGAIADALRRLSGNQTLRESIAQAGHALWSQQFAWSEIAARIRTAATGDAKASGTVR